MMLFSQFDVAFQMAVNGSKLFFFFSDTGVDPRKQMIDWNSNNYEAPKGSVNCENDAPRQTVPGIDLVEHSTVETFPEGKIASKIFKFEREIPTSCQRYGFKNVIVKATASGDTGSESFSASSAYEIVKEHGQEISASVAVKYMAVSASVGTSHSTHSMTEQTHSSNETWKLERVKTVDSEIRIISNSGKWPNLDPTFAKIIREKCDKPLEEVRSQNKKWQKKDKHLRKLTERFNEERGKIIERANSENMTKVQRRRLLTEVNQNETREYNLFLAQLPSGKKSWTKAEFSCGQALHEGRSLFIVEAEIGSRGNKVRKSVFFFLWFSNRR